jgi:prepilin-type N-terminal cleavage/methylation domain-containing protein
MTRIPAPRGVRHAFTLLELLVVIGIIVLLLGMLFPVIKKIQYASYSANTQQEISQLENAINQYYATFHAYPGPFSNDVTQDLFISAAPVGAGSTPGINLETYLVVNGTATYSTPVLCNTGYTSKVNITGTQNLVLGLLGGLRIDPGAPTGTNLGDPAFAPGEVGLGPLTLTNAINASVYIPQRNPPFLNVSSGGSTSLLMWCWAGNNRSSQAPSAYFAKLNGFTDLAGKPAYDAAIPVFVDRFPDPGPLPILYLRARTGVKGILSDGTVMLDQGTGLAAVYQYDIRDIFPYTGEKATSPTVHIGLPIGQSHDLLPPPAGGYTFTVAAGSTAPAAVTGAGVNGVPDAGAYFYDPSIAPTDTISQQYIDYTGRPRAVDSFILISAGPDGIYGTTDDITSFGTVSH